MILELEKGDTLFVRTDGDQGELFIDLEGKIQFTKF